MQFQVKTEQAVHGGDAVGFQHHFLFIAVIVHAVVVALDLATHHLLLDIVWVKIGLGDVVDDDTVA